MVNWKGKIDEKTYYFNRYIWVGKELKLVNKDKESLEECFTKIERWVLEEGEKTI